MKGVIQAGWGGWRQWVFVTFIAGTGRVLSTSVQEGDWFWATVHTIGLVAWVAIVGIALDTARIKGRLEPK